MDCVLSTMFSPQRFCCLRAPGLISHGLFPPPPSFTYSLETMLGGKRLQHLGIFRAPAGWHPLLSPSAQELLTEHKGASRCLTLLSPQQLKFCLAGGQLEGGLLSLALRCFSRNECFAWDMLLW